MNTLKIPSILSLLLIVACALLFATHTQAETVTIWPIGDSITKGVGGEPHIGALGPSRHYRAYLQNILTTKNITYDFIGTETYGANYVLNGLMADGNHDGYGGQGVYFFNQNLGSTIPWPTEDPDFILVHLGTNDYTNSTVTNMQSTYTWFLNNMLRANCPTSTIIVQGVGERTDQTLTTSRAEMNAMLQNIVNTLTSQGDSNIFFVENTTTLEDVEGENLNYLGENIADGIHPRYTGHERIANQFWSIMNTIIDSSTSRSMPTGS